MLRCLGFSAVFLLAGVLLLTSCASDRNEPSANVVGFDDTSPNATASGSTGVVSPEQSNAAANSTDSADSTGLVASSGGDALAPFTEDDVLDAVNAYVDTRDEVLVGDEALDSLSLIANPGIVAQVEAAQVENLANIEAFNGSARMSYVTWPDFVDVQRRDDRIVAVSCTERWSERRSGNYQISFIDEAFIFDIVDDALVLSEVRTAHDGEPGTGGLTCFSGILGERAVDAARAGIEALDAIDADPSRAATTDFESLFGGVAYDTFAALATNIDQTTRRISPVETRYTPLGLDPASLDFLGLVSVCRYYPEGVYDEDIATGQRLEVNADYGPGASFEDIIHVWIEPKRRVEGGVEQFFDFEANVSEGCW